MNILYCGDQDNAPLYIQGALEYAGHRVTHVFPGEPISQVSTYDTYILSDYPAADLDKSASEAIIKRVAEGKRLIMLGGWESFNGFGRNYYNHPIGKILPVVMKPGDDRVNAFQGLILRHVSSGKAVTKPEWNEPPVICGYNDARARVGGEVLVEMVPIRANAQSVSTAGSLPLVVKRAYEQGIVIACLTDLAPHWSGGLTDWGMQTIRLLNGTEVGDSFLKFVQFLVEA